MRPHLRLIPALHERTILPIARVPAGLFAAAVPASSIAALTFVNCFLTRSEGRAGNGIGGRRMEAIANFLSGVTGRNLDNETVEITIIPVTFSSHSLTALNRCRYF